MLDIVFMGTPDFAKESLEAIYNAGHNIIAVITNPDRPKGRGMKMIASPVKEFAIEKSIPVLQPEKIREIKDTLEQINPDLFCVVAYGKILPQDILDIPKKGSINVHGSLLPQYRGAAPIQWAVLNGDKKTGITTMYMNAGMDTGDMILQEEVQIGEDETTGELWDRLSKIGAKLLVETVAKIEKGTAPRTPQSGEFTMAPMLNKEMARIDWINKNSREIKNLVRGLNPIMGAYTTYNDKKIKIWRAGSIELDEFIENHPEFADYKISLNNMEGGAVIYSDIKQGLYVKAKTGIVIIQEVQAENAKRMPVQDFLRGNLIQTGEVFE
jgi:methionyl-tRNA formyltransferase